jgi:hypothetical protein
MKSPIQRNWNETPLERQLRRQQSIEILNARGDNRKPYPPRGVSSQPGSRKAVISWDAPLRMDRVKGFNIYKDNALYQQVSDPRLRRTDVAMAADGSYANVFVASFSEGGRESNRVQVICNATAEASAPADPSTPAVDESSEETIPTDTERENSKFIRGLIS